MKKEQKKLSQTSGTTRELFSYGFATPLGFVAGSGLRALMIHGTRENVSDSRPKERRESLSPSPERKTERECAWLGWREMTEPLRRVRERQRGGERCHFSAPLSRHLRTNTAVRRPPPAARSGTMPHLRQTERHEAFSPPSSRSTSSLFPLSRPVPHPKTEQRSPHAVLCIFSLAPTRTHSPPTLIAVPTFPSVRESAAQKTRAK